MTPDVDYTLYLVTDRDLMTTATVEDSVELAIKGGVTLVQLREKTANSNEFYNTAVNVRNVCRKYNIPLIINDRVDIALAVDADGVHVGQHDIPAKIVRDIIGPEKILGISASNLSEALAAANAGADYLGVGAMQATNTKNDANLTSMTELAEIRSKVKLPIVVIGGIGHDNAFSFAQAGVDGLAVVSAIVAQNDITKATKELKSEFLRGLSKE